MTITCARKLSRAVRQRRVKGSSMSLIARTVAAATAALSFASFASSAPIARGEDPFADSVEDYDPGPSPTAGFTNPLVTLGSPERFTGEEVFPSVVSPFSPAFLPEEIVSISPGGHLTLAFDEPVTNDPNNLFGIDLIIFNNAGFIDGAFPSGIVSGIFGDDGGMIEVSADSKVWHTIPSVIADGLMPTLGYLDSGPYDDTPGTILSDFTRPVDPTLTLSHLLNLDMNGLRTFYRGSGGGAGVDIELVGLQSISFVRISLPPSATDNMEIDAVSDVSPRRPGDVDLDGDTDVDDLIAVILGWGAVEPGDPPADFDNNGFVDVDDLITVILNWGTTP
jgi:hypothetical protein